MMTDVNRFRNAKSTKQLLADSASVATKSGSLATSSLRTQPQPIACPQAELPLPSDDAVT